MIPATCHPDRRHRARGLCHSCYGHLKGHERWVATTPEARATRSADRRAAYAATHPPTPRLTPDEIRLRRPIWRRRVAARRLGLSIPEYEALVAKHEGACAICGSVPVGRALDLDHDHATGRVRGLLCRSCNAGLGLFGDRPERLRLAAAYLEAVA